MLCHRWTPYARRRTQRSSPALTCVCVCDVGLVGVQVRRSAGKEAPAAEDARTQTQTPQQTKGSSTVPRTPGTGETVLQSPELVITKVRATLAPQTA